MALETVFCVQPYLRIGGELTKGELSPFTNVTQAGAKVRVLEPVVAGVVLFAVKGCAEVDYWGEPDVIDIRGEVPLPAY